jgi:hypothetical protein
VVPLKKLPCPFCGEYINTEIDHSSGCYFKAVKSIHALPEDVINAWNKRKVDKNVELYYIMQDIYDCFARVVSGCKTNFSYIKPIRLTTEDVEMYKNKGFNMLQDVINDLVKDSENTD